ncbi:YhdP family protein [Roseomonas gilardii]|uniref:YhdP family protein n=1 Tax=Roseomonas gilardii TaxID=257708 RepID=UPI0004B0681A|nr:DUF3971 domain-containing protein [Roseomonas gilardii]
MPAPGPGRRLRRVLGRLFRRGFLPALVSLTHAAMTLAAAAGLVACVLLWRLQAGPLPAPMLAAALEQLASGDGVDLRIGAAALSWQPPADSAGSPALSLRLYGLQLPDASGKARLELPEIAAQLPARNLLLRGAYVPETLTVDGPLLVLEVGPDGLPDLPRAKDGRDGRGAAAGDGSRGPARPLPDENPLQYLLRRSGARDRLAALHEVRVNAARLEVRDHDGVLRAVMQGGDLLLRRDRPGGTEGENMGFRGGGSLRVGSAEGSLRFSGHIGAAPAALELRISLPAMRPAEIAAELPVLAPLAGLDAPVALEARLRYSRDGVRGQLDMRAGGGALSLPDGGRAVIGRGPDAASLSLRLDGVDAQRRPWGHVEIGLRQGRLEVPGLGTVQVGDALPGMPAASGVPEAGGISAAAAMPALRLSASLGEPDAHGQSSGAAEVTLGRVAVSAVTGERVSFGTAPSPSSGRAAPGAARSGAAGNRAPDQGARPGDGAGSPPPAAPAPAAGAESRIALRFSGLDLLQWNMPRAGLDLRLGSGQVAQPDGTRIGFHGIEAEVEAGPDRATLQRLRLALAEGAGARGTAPVATAQGEALRRAEGWRWRLGLGVDRTFVPDLALYWPASVAPGGRSWIVENLTAGTARDGQWEFGGLLPANGGMPKLETMTGLLTVEDATVHWLRPVPPVEHMSGTIRFLSPAEILVEGQGGRQQGTALAAQEVRVRLYDLDIGQEKTEISGRVAGPLNDMLRVVDHPRLHLLQTVPVDLSRASGKANATVHLAFPLLADLPAERIAVAVKAQVTDAALPDLLLDQSLRKGRATLELTEAGMRLDGTADLGPLRAARMGMQVDFRDGPPGQLVVKGQVEGPAELAALRGTRLDILGDRIGGQAAVSARFEQHRGAETQVEAKADLAQARLSLAPLNWRKAPGPAARAEMSMRLRDGALRGIDGLRIEAPDLLLRGGAEFAPGSRITRLTLAEGRAGASRVSGELGFPEGPDGFWRIVARGPVLDLRGADPDFLGTPEEKGSAERGALPGFDADIALGQVLTTDGPFERVEARIRHDARGVLRQLQASGRFGGQEAFAAAITPRAGGGRTLSVRVADLGRLLRLTGTTGDVQDGRLRVQGHWAADTPASPLLGEAELENFGLRGRARLGKLLQALSLYGIPEALAGPGLRVTRLHAPFALTREALGLEDVRLSSASLGATAKGRVMRRDGRLELEGTIVPSYLLNSLPGRLPLVGRLFSAEPGGGLLAATFTATGTLGDPRITVNPLAMLAPGVLRNLFGSDAPPRTPSRER